jgi:hypothetical protein
MSDQFVLVHTPEWDANPVYCDGRVFVGAQDAADNIDECLKAGITHVVSIRENWSEYQREYPRLLQSLWQGDARSTMIESNLFGGQPEPWIPLIASYLYCTHSCFRATLACVLMDI